MKTVNIGPVFAAIFVVAILSIPFVKAMSGGHHGTSDRPELMLQRGTFSKRPPCC